MAEASEGLEQDPVLPQEKQKSNEISNEVDISSVVTQVCAGQCMIGYQSRFDLRLSSEASMSLHVKAESGPLPVFLVGGRSYHALGGWSHAMQSG